VQEQWYCETCSKWVLDDDIKMLSRPCISIKVDDATQENCYVAAGNEMALFGETCEAMLSSGRVKEPIGDTFMASVGVSKARVVITKLSRVPPPTACD
jgi:hypothetical protein